MTGLEYIDCGSRRAAVRACAENASAAVACAGAVDVVVPAGLEDYWKASLSETVPMGARVQSYEHWLQTQWDLNGDGRLLATPQERSVILRPLLKDVVGLEPTAAYVEMLAAFVVDAVSTGNSLDDLNDSCLKIAANYLQRLKQYGIAESAAVEQKLAACQKIPMIFVEPDESRVRMRNIMQAMSRHVSVKAVRRLEFGDGAALTTSLGELCQLHAMLFSGEGSLGCRGEFVAAEVHGVHAEPDVVLQLIDLAAKKGIAYNQMALLLEDPADAYPHLLDQLNRAGVPVCCEFSLPLKKTPFGMAFLQLHNMLDPAQDEEYIHAAAFVASPYSGLSSRDARAFQMSWRGKAGSDSINRNRDLISGIKGRLGSKEWEEKLAPLKALLLEPNPAQRVRIMFENGKNNAFDVQRLADDAAAAEVLIDYLTLCSRFSEVPCLRAMEEMPVPLVRASNENGEGVLVCSVDTVLERDFVILGRLSKTCYPMATLPQPFDGQLAGMGGEVRPSAARKNRIRLLDSIESATSMFAAYRLCTNIEGDEECQSALWDELMTCYRGSEDADKPVQALPNALAAAGCTLRVSEKGCFDSAAPSSLETFPVRRGLMERPEALDLLFPNYKEHAETFSPTALEDYYRCPYKWFVSRRIGANPLDKPFDQIAKGNLAHNFFQRVYGVFAEEGIDRVTSSNLSRALEIANETFDYQWRHEVDRGRMNLVTQRDYRQVEDVRRQVLGLIERDAEFLPGFVPAYSELVLEMPDDSAIEYAGVPMRGKVDRIDVDKQGRAIVIDYKLSGLSAGYGVSKKNGMPSKVQTDIYAVLVQRCLSAQGIDVQVIGSVYRSYAKNSLRGVYAGGINWGCEEKVQDKLDALPNEVFNGSYDDYLKQLEETLACAVDRLRSGDIAPAPIDDDTCTYCLAAPFCPKKRV